MDKLQRRLAGTALIILGAYIILAAVLFSYAPAGSDQQSGTVGVTVGPNMTAPIGTVGMGKGTLALTWVASGPINLYVLNESQYVTFKQGATAHYGQYPYYTTQPKTSMYSAVSAKGATVDLPAGSYFFLASASQNVTVVTLSETYPSPSSFTPSYLGYAEAAGFGALGVILVALGVTLWRRPRSEPSPPERA